ncbi:MAG: hypothetical protein AAFX79_04740 [Planctomycetota bacterium]
MHRCVVNPAVERIRINGFAFPLGVYPIEPVSPKPGYTVDFEPADGDEEWEEWPDRYVYEVLVSAERLRFLCSAMFSLLPGRIYPILDVLGNDAFREIDPYIAYELVGTDALYDGIRWFEPFLFEDGLCGFGAMSDDPFIYFFVDEHKVLTIRVETAQKERVDRLLAAFDLAALPGEIQAADAVNHEHRSVLLTPEDRPELLGHDEVAEGLVDLWGMTLNIDVEQNTDDDGRELGITAWRCVVRDVDDRPDPKRSRRRYAEVLLTAGSWRDAEELAIQAASQLPERRLQLPKAAAAAGDGGSTPEADWSPEDADEPFLHVVTADRLTANELRELAGAPIPDEALAADASGRILRARWLE